MANDENLKGYGFHERTAKGSEKSLLWVVKQAVKQGEGKQTSGRP